MKYKGEQELKEIFWCGLEDRPNKTIYRTVHHGFIENDVAYYVLREEDPRGPEFSVWSEEEINVLLEPIKG